MKGCAFHAHVLAASPSAFVGVCLAPLKTTCCMEESKKDESSDKKILIVLEKLKKMAHTEKKFKIDFDGWISPPSLYASLARIFHTFFGVEGYEIIKCLLKIDEKSAISFLGGFSFIKGTRFQKISVGKIGMILVKMEGIASPSPYAQEMKSAMLAGNIERIGSLCEKGRDSVPLPLQKIWDMVRGLREKGMPCYLSLDAFPLVITYPEILGEIINALQVKNFDVEIVTPDG